MRLRVSLLALAVAFVGLATGPAVADPTPSTGWTVQSGSSGYDRALGIAIDQNDNRYVVGQTELGGNQNATIASYDPNGALRWDTSLATPSADLADAVAVVDSSVFVVGYTDGDLEGETNSGSRDAFLARYTTDGDLEWVKLFGTSASERFFSVEALPDGNLAVVGYTSGNLISAGGTPQGQLDTLILVLDQDGNVREGRQTGTAANDEARKIGVADGGTFYVSGYSFGSFEGPNGGSADAWVTEYEWDGERLDRIAGWQSGLPGVDSGRGVVATGDMIYTAFAFDGLGGDRDIRLVRWDGSIENTPQFHDIGTAGHDDTIQELILADGEPVVVGSSAGNTDNANVNPGTYDLFAARWIGGTVRDWWVQFGSSSDDLAYAAAMDSSLGITIVGTTDGSIGRTNPNSDGDTIIRSFFAQRDQNPLPLAEWDERAGAADGRLAAMAAGPDGTVYVAGNGGTGTPTRYFFRAHEPEDGSIRWTVEAESADVEYIDIAVGTRPGDPVVVLAEFRGIPGNGEDYLLRAHDPDTGALRWINSFGATANEFPQAVAVDETGAIFVTGYTAQSGAFTDTSVFVSRHEPDDGSETWSATFESDDFDTSRDVDAHGGTVFVAGYTFGSLASPPAGDADAFVVAFGADDGAERWRVQVGDNARDEAVAIRAHDGGVAWAGSTETDLFGPHGGQTDVIVQSLDPTDGAVVWSTQFGGSGSEGPGELTVDQWGVTHVVGASNGDLFEARNPPLEGWIASLAPLDGAVVAGEHLWLGAGSTLNLTDVEMAGDGAVVLAGVPDFGGGLWIQRRVVRPSVLTGATLEARANTILLDWEPVLGGGILYEVAVDGEIRCTTTSTACVLTDVPADTDLDISVNASNGLGVTGVTETIAALQTCDSSLSHPFTDISSTSFADDSVACIRSIGVTTGTSPTTYSPAGLVTREQMAAFLGRLYRYATGTACSGPNAFADVAATSFAVGDIACIKDLGVTTGTSSTTYSPAGFVTREQMAAFLARMLRVITGEPCDDHPHPFTDVPESSFAYDDVGCIFHHGITTGTSSTTYSPAGQVTREQMAAFLERLYTYVSDPDRPLSS